MARGSTHSVRRTSFDFFGAPVMPTVVVYVLATAERVETVSTRRSGSAGGVRHQAEAEACGSLH